MPPKGHSSNKKTPKVAPSKDVERDHDFEDSSSAGKVWQFRQSRKPAVNAKAKEVHNQKPAKKGSRKILKPKSPEPQSDSNSSDHDKESFENEVTEDEEVETVDKEEEEEGDDNNDKQHKAESLMGTSEDKGLVEGDSLYLETPIPERVQLAKRPAPDTPPLDTRASRCLSTAQKISQASPTKKVRYLSPPLSDTEFSTPSKMPNTVKNKGKAKAKEIPVNKSSAKKVSANKKGHKNAELKAIDNNEQLDLEKLEELNRNDGIVHLQDLTILRIKVLPEVCKVDSPDDQDLLLKRVGAYKNLPHLEAVYVEPLCQSPKMGLVNWSKWYKVIKDFPEPSAHHAIIFAKDSQYVNLARVDPRQLTAHKMWGGTHLEIHDLHNRPAIALTPIMIVDSYVKELNTQLNFLGNYFTGIMHSQEWACFVSTIEMVTQHKSLHMQIWADAITFGTKGQSSSHANSSTGTPGHNNLPDIPGLFNLNASPSRRAGGPHMKFANIAPLEYGHAIPVYDGCGVQFDYNATVFNDMDNNFAKYKGEIPRSSHVIAAYLTQVQKLFEQYRIVVYPVWALLIATP